MGLVDFAGNTVASYTYDPYGKPLTATGELAEKNPLRYRGYYYDSETGFYYLQSRYYDPATRRFVNADSYSSTGQGILGINMFAYCLNDPVNHIDSSGKSALLILGVIAAGAIVGGILGAFNAAASGGNVVENMVEGFLAGGVAGAGIDFLVQAGSQYVETGTFDFDEVDWFRCAKIGIETGIGASVPSLGTPASDGVDAIGTMVLWGETSALIACGDAAISAFTSARKTQGGTSSRSATMMLFA